MRIISGQFKGRLLFAPKGDRTRPTSSLLREAVFNICGDFTGADVLDVFCGSGAIGLEALSRGARSATFIDNSPQAIQTLSRNLDNLNLKGVLLKLDALAALKKLAKEEKSFDFIYVDPPYEAEPKKKGPLSSYAARILPFIDTHPLLLKLGGTLFIEEGGDFERIGPLSTLKEGQERTIGKSKLFQFTALE